MVKANLQVRNRNAFSGLSYNLLRIFDISRLTCPNYRVLPWSDGRCAAACLWIYWVHLIGIYLNRGLGTLTPLLR